jgi:phospholipid transport system substrate-binding protein
MNRLVTMKTQADQYCGAIASGHQRGLAQLLATFALTFAIAVFNLALAAHCATTVGDPLTMVKSTVGQVLETLQNHSTPQAERQRRVLQSVAGHFDFADMARSSLGYNWKKLSPAQQQQFVPLFTAFMEDAYLNKLNNYSGQQVRFIGQNSMGDGLAEVKSVVESPDRSQPPIRINYELKQVDGDWKVYDVTVDDISITANYRNQFNRVIANQGFDALISAMREKEQELRSSIGA